MTLIDFMLNVVGLVLWLSWLSIQFDPLARASAASLAGTLRKADYSSSRRWQFLALVATLILLRAIFYFLFGSELNCDPTLRLGLINLPFRSDDLWRMLLFSTLDFALVLAGFYFWVILLSVVNRRIPDTDPLQKLVRLHFRRVERWPRAIKLVMPLLAGILFWLALHPVFDRMGIVPKNKSLAQLFEQAAIVGAGTYLAWKYLIVGILLLHLLNSYVYLGNHAFWHFVNATARNLLAPVRWLPLRAGKVDFLPLAAIALVFFVTETLARLPARFYQFLPF